MNSSRGNIEFYPRRRDLLLILLALLFIAYLSYWHSLTPRFMHDGKSSGNVFVGRMFAVLAIMPIPFFAWKLIKPKKSILSLTPFGIRDIRLYNDTIPWHEIKNVSVFAKQWHDRHTSYIYIEVPKKFVVKTLNDTVKQSFAAYTTDGLVVLRIYRPWLFQDIHELHSTIKTYWVDHRA